MSDHLLLGVAALIGGIGGKALVVLVAESRWRRAGLWITATLGVGGAVVILVTLLDADHSWISFVSRYLLVIGLVVAVLAGVRACLPGIFSLRFLGRRDRGTRQAQQASEDKDPVDQIVQYLTAKFGQDEAIARVSDAAYFRSRRSGPMSSVSPAHITRRDIGKDPDRAHLHLRSLKQESFDRLVDRVDQRTEAKQRREVKKFRKAAIALADAADRYRRKDELSSADWQDLRQRHSEARKAARALPVDRYVAYTGYLRELGKMINRQAHPSTNAYPIVLTDLRNRLSEDERR